MSGVQLLEVPEADAGQRLDRWFKRLFPHVPHGRVEKLLRTGQLRVDGGRVKGSHRLEAGQEVRVPPLPDPSEVKARKQGDRDWLADHAIYEDDELIAINKPFGLAVQGGSKTVRHVDRLLPEGYRLVHRLDRDTSGVLLIAKHARAAKSAARAFQSKRAEKTYWAITNGVPTPEAGEIKGYLAKGKMGAEFGKQHLGKEVMQPVRHGHDGAKHARTLYSTDQKAGAKAALVVMRPLTGRTHQLRVHAQLLGSPIAGDPKYMTDRPLPGGLDTKLHLHARELVIPRDGRGELHLSAPLPAHMKSAFDRLGFSMDVAPVDWEAL